MGKFGDKTNFSYEVDRDFNFVIEETGNTSVCLRKISWNSRPYKLDLRKYTYQDGEEKMMKGVSLSDNGADELVKVLAQNGYGDTKLLTKYIKEREDYYDGCENDITEDDLSNDSGEFFDPSVLVS